DPSPPQGAARRRTAAARSIAIPAGRQPGAAGRQLGRSRGELRAVLGARDACGALPVRRAWRTRSGTHRTARADRRGVARLSAGGAAGAAVWLPRLRTLRASPRV